MTSTFNPNWIPTEAEPYDDLYREMERHELADDTQWFLDELRSASHPALQFRFMEFVSNLGLDTLGSVLTDEEIEILEVETGISMPTIAETPWYEAQTILNLTQERVKVFEDDIDNLDHTPGLDWDVYQIVLKATRTIEWAISMEKLFGII